MKAWITDKLAALWAYMQANVVISCLAIAAFLLLIMWLAK